MKPISAGPAAVAQPAPKKPAQSGYWTVRGIGAIAPQLDALSVTSNSDKCK